MTAYDFSEDKEHRDENRKRRRADLIGATVTVFRRTKTDDPGSRIGQGTIVDIDKHGVPSIDVKGEIIRGDTVFWQHKQPKPVLQSTDHPFTIWRWRE